MYRNCPNCDVLYDIKQIKCPFCGTLYLDFSCIDFDNRQPFFLKLKYGGVMIVQKVIPVIGNVSIHDDTYSVCDGLGNCAPSYIMGCNSNIQIEFEGVS